MNLCKLLESKLLAELRAFLHAFLSCLPLIGWKTVDLRLYFVSGFIVLRQLVLQIQTYNHC